MSADIFIVAVVEDNDDLRSAVSSAMRARGHKVFEFAGGEAAFAWLKENSANLIISDIDMPKGSGIWLTKQLRSQGIQIPLLLMSGGNPGFEKTFTSIGADGFIEKPFRLVALLEAAQMIQENRKAG